MPVCFRSSVPRPLSAPGPGGSRRARKGTGRRRRRIETHQEGGHRVCRDRIALATSSPGLTWDSPSSHGPAPAFGREDPIDHRQVDRQARLRSITTRGRRRSNFTSPWKVERLLSAFDNRYSLMAASPIRFLSARVTPVVEWHFIFAAKMSTPSSLKTRFK